MGDVGESFEGWKEESQERKRRNLEQSTKILEDRGILFESKNGGVHIIIKAEREKFDFWPSTGKFTSRVTKKSGRGVFKLLKIIADGERK